ncbi:MAG: efflux RND transporter permease subunit [Comamonadaceae bacterium]|nr:efflux RND transporter permease subunit [Comamonadaceae bacterium]
MSQVHRPARRAERGRRRRRAERRHARTCRCASAGAVQLGRRAAALADPRRQPGHRAASTLRLGDIAEVRRGYVDPPRGDGAPPGPATVIALGVSMAKGGDIIALGPGAAARRRRASRPSCRWASSWRRCRTSRAAVARSVGEFVKVLVEAVVIVLAVSFISLGLHTQAAAHRHLARPGGGASRSRWCWRSPSSTMYYWGVGLHKISLGALIIALGLLVDDAIIAVEMMVRKLEEGYDQRARRHLRLRADRDADAHRHADHRRRLPADRRWPSRVTGEYTFAIFAVTAAALVISWVVVGATSCPTSARWLLHKPQRADGEAQRTSCSTRRSTRRFRAPGGLVRASTAGSRSALTLATLRAGHRRHGPRAAAVLPRLEPARDPGRPVAARGLDASQRPRRWRAASRRGCMQRAGRRAASTAWVGTGVPRFYLPLDQHLPAEQRQPGRSCCRRTWPTREALRARAAAAAGRASSPRCAAASSCCPTGRRCRTRCSSASSGDDAGAVRALGRPRPRRCCAPTRTCAASTTTGTSRSRRCAWRSTRTRRARSASPARRIAQASRTILSRHARSASTARATS